MSNLFQDCLGEKFSQLPTLVKQAHTGSSYLSGRASVQHGNLLGRLVCHIFSMPPARDNSGLTVRGEHSADVMTWNRHFNDFAMNSHFYKAGSQLVERLGPIHMAMALDVSEGKLSYRLCKTKLFGLPIPLFLSPKVLALEWQEARQYCFSVDVRLPLIGKVLSYQGEMSVENMDDVELNNESLAN